MKKCPYCAEDIQDEAIKCRYCQSDLTVPPPTAAARTQPFGGDAGSATSVPPGSGTSQPTSTWSAPPAATTSAPADLTTVRYTHSGYRWVLGYGGDFFGIWDRQSPDTPAERFPRTDEGWRQAWTRFVALEPHHTAVPQEGSSGMGTASGSAAGAAGIDPTDHEVVQYTHSGQRYLLGYGRTFFGIWDRQSPTAPVEKFPRDDDGWAAAWRRYVQMEPNFAEVSQGGDQAGSAGAGPSGS